MKNVFFDVECWHERKPSPQKLSQNDWKKFKGYFHSTLMSMWHHIWYCRRGVNAEDQTITPLNLNIYAKHGKDDQMRQWSGRQRFSNSFIRPKWWPGVYFVFRSDKSTMFEGKLRIHLWKGNSLVRNGIFNMNVFSTNYSPKPTHWSFPLPMNTFISLL